MEDFTPRAYQVDLYETALKQNTIIYLPTGSGKTYIAVMLIKKYSNQVALDGGKRIVFIVNTVPLVMQQSEYIARHTGLLCKGYSGDMGVDYWTPEEWKKEIDTSQVLVMVGEIFLTLLNHGHMKLSDVCLLIFDECHKAVGNHNMRLIMKAFEHVDQKDHPRILGLTATILNSNITLKKITQAIRELEVTFNARIATTKSVCDVKEYGNQNEIITWYNPPECHPIQKKLNVLFDQMHKVLTAIQLKDHFECNMSSKELAPKAKNLKLNNLVDDGREHIETMGLYGGSKALLLNIIRLEHMKKSNDNIDFLKIVEFLITQMMKMRKLIDVEMGDLSELEKMYRFSSDRIIKTFDVLEHFNEKKKSDQKFCAIIFVHRRTTAFVMYHILKNLRENDKNFDFLQPDYVMGYTVNPYKNPRENLCLSKWNKEALVRFRSGRSNCIVATDVVDEGVDIPNCTLILRYDLPHDFRSYIQSKGRARQKNSNYVVLVSNTDDEFIPKHDCFVDVEKQMKEQLIGHTDEREEVTTVELDEMLYKSEIEPYIVTNSDGVKTSITEISAISLINRYCANLNKSKFVSLTPTWKLRKFIDPKSSICHFQVFLKLPMTSLLRKIIQGDIMDSIDLAKKSAALKACIALHEIGELNDNLLPTQPNAVLSTTEYLFPHWRNEPSNVQNGIPGTYGKKRTYDIKYPESLYSALPSVGDTAYRHVIQAIPSYPKPCENRQAIFHDLLNDRAGFALLSTKQLPQIPDFPIFMNVGELNVHIEVNSSTVKISSEEWLCARNFHWILFNEILKVVKSFMVFDTANLSNSFLIVPLDKNGEISWSIMREYMEMTDIPTCNISNVYDFELALVKPNYRSASNVYVVTQICDDIMVESAFPNGDFRSYKDYYKERHGIVINDPKEPMLEVKAISQKIDCTRPRSIKAGLSKRKYADVLEQFEEHFVGELCTKIKFPAVYWLKATYLPSVLHRINQLLVADDLRVRIASEANLGVTVLPTNTYWPPIIIQANNDIDEQPEAVLELSQTDELLSESSTIPIDIPGPEIDTLEMNLYPWKRESEPTNLWKHIDRIQLIDVEYYHQFMSNPLSNDADDLQKKRNRGCEYAKRDVIDAPKLKMLSNNDPNGPSPAHIMEALTTKSSGDVFNLERLETLGDSYLKFAVSLYLYESNPTFNEGQLTEVKGKLVGNRNLSYCGMNKLIPNSMKVEPFEPTRNFVPPMFIVMRDLQKILVDTETSPNVLYELNIPANEQLTGKLSSRTIDIMEEKVFSWRQENPPSGMEVFLGVQNVSDKSIADSVEAFIGVYVNSVGINETFKLLMWLNILPPELQVEQLLHERGASPSVGNDNPDDHLPQAEYIENQIGYKFRDRAYLLQAFTHPSYTPNNLTPSYERLEFLGDAICDFLITIYIYERCGNLNPGALTDLRSALVNNVTFACISVKYGLHTALLAYAPKLQEIIERFVKYQADRNHVVNDELLWTLLEEDDCRMAEFVDVPKILGDIFESVIGAIYLDSGKNLNVVWNVIYGLMHKEIATFSKQVPKTAIRVIHETPGANPRFLKPLLLESSNNLMVTLEVMINGIRKPFHGFGSNKNQAKQACAKQALKSIRKDAS